MLNSTLMYFCPDCHQMIRGQIALIQHQRSWTCIEQQGEMSNITCEEHCFCKIVTRLESEDKRFNDERRCCGCGITTS